MGSRIDAEVIHLEAGEVLDIHDGAGLAVTCLGGTVWITQSHDPADVVLDRGQSFVLDRAGLALVSAPVAPAAIAVRAVARPASSTGAPAPHGPRGGRRAAA